jgi:hypothetical protein
MREGEKEESQGDSFRQSRKEFLVMVAAWAVFATWTIIYVGRNSSSEPGEPLRLVLGMPDWVVFGILIPWGFGLAFTMWFSLCFMRDTDLESISEEGEKE